MTHEEFCGLKAGATIVSGCRQYMVMGVASTGVMLQLIGFRPSPDLAWREPVNPTTCVEPVGDVMAYYSFERSLMVS